MSPGKPQYLDNSPLSAASGFPPGIGGSGSDKPGFLSTVLSDASSSTLNVAGHNTYFIAGEEIKYQPESAQVMRSICVYFNCVMA